MGVGWVHNLFYLLLASKLKQPHTFDYTKGTTLLACLQHPSLLFFLGWVSLKVHVDSERFSP